MDEASGSTAGGAAAAEPELHDEEAGSIIQHVSVIVKTTVYDSLGNELLVRRDGMVHFDLL